MMLEIEHKYYRFGSKDSIDIDVLVNHPEATGQEKDKNIINALKNQFPGIADWNVNIISIENGVVVKSIPSKGSPDGVNNSLFETYHLHEQKFPFPLERKLDRNVDAAIEKCLTAIFTFFKRTNQEEFYKSIPKEIKNGEAPMKERLAKLSEFDFNLLPYDDDMRNRNAFKSIAFIIGQTLSLLNGIEIYTKSDLILNHVELTDFILRKQIKSNCIINQKMKQLIELLDVRTTKIN